MKTTFLLTILLFHVTIILGQTYSSSNPQFSWGNWEPVNTYQGFYVRAQKAYFNKGANQWYWNWEIQNRSSKKAAISWKFYNKNKEQFIKGTSSRHIFKPNEIIANGSFGAEDILSYIFDNLCTEFKYVNGIELENCGGKSNNSTTQPNNSTQQTQPQNDPAFDRNNASFQDYYKKAMAAKDAGNYVQAESYLNSAISVAVNDTQRDNAKSWLSEIQKGKSNENYNVQKQQEAQRQQQLVKQQQQQYNNNLNQAANNLQTGNYNGAMQSYTNALNSSTTKSEKKLAATGVVATGALSIFDAIAKQKQEKREQERLEQERRDRERMEREREEQRTTEIMEGNWQEALELAKKKDYNRAIQIMLPYLRANKINAYATGAIGTWYYGLQDYENAKYCYEKAIKIDVKDCSMHNLGTLYQYGLGVEMNYETALAYYKISCDNEDKTGCENYNDLKPLVDEAKKREKEEKEKAKIIIADFNFKPHVDYLVTKLEAQGFFFDKVTFFSKKEWSKNIGFNFLRNNRSLQITFLIQYEKGLDTIMYYNVDDMLQEDFSRLQIPSLIGKQKISNTLSKDAFSLLSSVPKPVSSDAFKNSKYLGFQKETSINNEETIDAYQHNYNISFGNDAEQIKWLNKIVNAGGDIAYYVQLEKLYRDAGEEAKALETFRMYVSKLSNSKVLHDLSKQVQSILKSKVEIYQFNKLVVLADAGEANASFEVATYFHYGEVRGESTRKGNYSGYVKWRKIERNWEKAVTYYAKAYDGNVFKGYAACAISKLYEKGGYGTEKSKKLYKVWKKKAKSAGNKCK